MPITRLEMVRFTFDSRVKRDRNAFGMRNRIGQTGDKRTVRHAAGTLVQLVQRSSRGWSAESRKLAAAVGSETEDERPFNLN